MESCKKQQLFFISTYGFLMMMSLSLQVSSSLDTIFANQSLSGVQTIVSSGGVFELGLFTPGISDDLYIGMWYRQVSPRTYVWVANQGFPAPNRESISLKVLNGNLVLYSSDDERTFWSTGVNSTDNNTEVQAVLLDKGNLVLRDGPSSSAAILWQSFDHPSDTWLPGAKLWFNKSKSRSQGLTSWKGSKDPSPGQYSLKVDPHTGYSLIMVWNGSKSYWSSGPFNDRLGTFRELVGAPELNLRFKLNVNESYITYSVRDPYQQSFGLVMDSSGQSRQYSVSDNRQLWYAPGEICEVYGYCGSFGICNETSLCKCAFPRITEEFSQGSDLDDVSGRCARNSKFQCDLRKNEFLPLHNMKLATDPTTSLVVTTTTTTTCASTCLANCSCKAYAYDGNQCLMWTKDVFNLRQLEANNTQGRTFYLKVGPFYINVSDSGTDSLKDIGSGKRNVKFNTTVLAISLSCAVAGVSFFVGLYCYISSPRKRAQKDKKQRIEIFGGGIIDAKDDDGEHMSNLSLNDIMAATNAFSEKNKLGEGGFGSVYKGNLQNGVDVAIKRLSKKSSQGLVEFKNEVVLIIKLQHKNLVRLLGYCVEGGEKLLIYEYMCNKSLDALLFDPLKCKELDWEIRMKIVIGTTKGLQYLHEDSRLKIIHRDLKASNILLDDEMNPKISDFGTARIFSCKQIDDSTERIVGTFGYMSPEYALGGMISDKSDIYSFGVLLLEIISGRKATRFVHNDQKHSLIAYAWESWCETKGVSIIDEALGDLCSLKEVIRCVHIALLCVQDHPKDRPTISQIVYMLSHDNDLPIMNQPTFTNVLNCNRRLAPSDYVFSTNEVTHSTMEGR